MKGHTETMRLRRAIVVGLVVAFAVGVRWIVRTAKPAKGYSREPLPRSVEDYRRGARPTGGASY